MPGLGFLCERSQVALDFVDPDDHDTKKDRPVVGVWVLDPDMRAEAERPDMDLCHLLVIVPNDQRWAFETQACEKRFRELAAKGAAAVAFMLPSGRGVPDPARNAARRYDVPLMVGDAGIPWPEIAQVISDERVREAESRIGRLEQILDPIHRTGEQRPGDRKHCTLRNVLDHLARAVDGSALLLDGRGNSLVPGPHPDSSGVDVSPSLIGHLARGELAAASIVSGRRRAHLHSVGLHLPRRILLVARDGEFTEAAGRTILQCAGLLDLVLRADEGDTRRRHLNRTTTALQTTVLKLLMSGNLRLAQDIGQSLWPGLFALRNVRVHVLEGMAQALAATATECHAAFRQSALVVRSPFRAGQLVVIAPEIPDSPGAADSADTDVTRRLQEMVANTPGLRMGTSRPRLLSDVGGALQEAHRALTAPGRADGRTVPGPGPEGDLATCVDPGAGRAWADSFFQPLDDLPTEAREGVLSTVDLAMRLSQSHAAKALGTHRNTIAARIAKVSDRLGLDLNRLADRAVLDLALRLRKLPRAPHPAHGSDGLSELLAGRTVDGWADAYLERLDEDRRELRRTLATWVACDGQVQQTARELGVHLKTVRNHLRGAEGLLGCRLLGSPVEAHDLVMALHIRKASPRLPERLTAPPARLPWAA
ncbi:helix-turn-helix domain-containing protein [Streptomyces abikoensis]|uniref:helix-turn-helix domain-containing protein n=1 Tax=Streptomyces abikoensis TaxID=97398 RepID=UPI0033D56D1D